MLQVTSQDGTRIAYEKLGSGPPLILVDGALCCRAIGPSQKLAPLLARSFTVYIYDRRGRGQSGDTQPYSVAREIEDLQALVRQAGESAVIVGLSSGAALALEAAAHGVNMSGLAVYEPPYMVDDAAQHRAANHEAKLRDMIATQRHGEAVKYFITKMVGMPRIFVTIMQLMPGFWAKLKKLAPTLPYDAAIMGDWSPPSARLSLIRTSTLAIAGEKSDVRLRRSVQAVTRAVPGAHRSELKGQSHNVKPEVLASALVEFFARETETCVA